MPRGGATQAPALVGAAVALVGVGVVVAAGATKKEQRQAEEPGQER